MAESISWDICQMPPDKQPVHPWCLSGRPPQPSDLVWHSSALLRCSLLCCCPSCLALLWFLFLCLVLMDEEPCCALSVISGLSTVSRTQYLIRFCRWIKEEGLAVAGTLSHHYDKHFGQENRTKRESTLRPWRSEETLECPVPILTVGKEISWGREVISMFNAEVNHWLP